MFLEIHARAPLHKTKRAEEIVRQASGTLCFHAHLTSVLRRFLCACSLFHCSSLLLPRRASHLFQGVELRTGEPFMHTLRWSACGSVLIISFREKGVGLQGKAVQPSHTPEPGPWSGRPSSHMFASRFRCRPMCMPCSMQFSLWTVPTHMAKRLMSTCGRHIVVACCRPRPSSECGALEGSFSQARLTVGDPECASILIHG